MGTVEVLLEEMIQLILQFILLILQFFQQMGHISNPLMLKRSIFELSSWDSKEYFSRVEFKNRNEDFFLFS